MTIDRRCFLSSIAATAACAPAVVALRPAEAATRLPSRVYQPPQRKAWFFAKQCRARSKLAVDFWTRPYCDIEYARYLPSGFDRGAMWYQEFDRDAEALCEKELEENGASYVENPRRSAWCRDGAADVPTVLRSLTTKNGSTQNRTAFLALDSIGPHPDEPAWAEMIPAFRSCYDRIIGHFHLERRGLHQWKEWLTHSFPSKDGKSYYQTHFGDAAAQCDVVVLTSSALLETDFGLSASERDEALVGEQIRRFDRALLDRAVAEHIAREAAAQSDKPRIYVLNSATCEYNEDACAHLYDEFHIEEMLFRQKQLIAGNFDETARRATPTLIVTGAANLRRGQIEGHGWAEQAFFRLRPSTRGPMSLDARGRPAKHWLQMITLWPIHVAL